MREQRAIAPLSARERRDERRDAPGEINRQGEDCAQLNHDRIHFPEAVVQVEMEKRFDDAEVRGRTDRQEFRQALDDSEQDGKKKVVHGAKLETASQSATLDRARSAHPSVTPESIAANSASTISRTSSSNDPVGCQPSAFFIFSAEPTKCTGSLGRSKAGLCFTYFSEGKFTTAKAASTKSRTEWVWPVATT